MATRSLPNTLLCTWPLISGSGILGFLGIINSTPSMIDCSLPGRHPAMLWTAIVFCTAGGIAMACQAFHQCSVETIVLE